MLVGSSLYDAAASGEEAPREAPHPAAREHGDEQGHEHVGVTGVPESRNSSVCKYELQGAPTMVAACCQSRPAPERRVIPHGVAAIAWKNRRACAPIWRVL